MPVVHDFAYTGAQQSITIPAGTESAVFEVWGASGYSDVNLGGPGGYVVGSIVVVPGQVFYIYVGQTGQGVIGGWNGGGSSQAGFARAGGGGGGATDIRFGGVTLADRIMVGGGGGGERFFSPSSGGAGGYPNGQAADGGYIGGGGQSGPGNGTAPDSAEVFATLGQGASTTASGTRRSAGGAGGLWGGNSHVGTAGGNFTAGGGGSSYYDAGIFTDVTAEAVGTWMGHGKARITLADPINTALATLGPLTAVGGAISTRRRYTKPYRHLIWVYGLDGARRNVID